MHDNADSVKPTGFDERLAEAIAHARHNCDTGGYIGQIDRDIAAAVAPLVAEARAEGYEQGKAKERVRVKAQAREDGRAEGYAAALADARTAINALDVEVFVDEARWGNLLGKHQAVRGFARATFDALARLDKAEA